MGSITFAKDEDGKKAVSTTAIGCSSFSVCTKPSFKALSVSFHFLVFWVSSCVRGFKDLDFQGSFAFRYCLGPCAMRSKSKVLPTPVPTISALFC
jgi:hypothetical protein